MKFEQEVMKAEQKYEKTLEALAGIYTEKELVKLEPTHIEVIHHEMIDRFGGIHGIRDNDLFLTICESPYQAIFGMECYPSVFDKAAKYLEGFAHYQAFLDGNKRTGFETMVVFLALNGYEFDMEPSQAEQFVLDIAVGKYSLELISKVLASNSILKPKAFQNEPDYERE